MEQKILSLQITEELYNWLKSMAEDNYMSISAYSRMLLLLKYEEYKKNGQNSNI